MLKNTDRSWEKVKSVGEQTRHRRRTNEAWKGQVRTRVRACPRDCRQSQFRAGRNVRGRVTGDRQLAVPAAIPGSLITPASLLEKVLTRTPSFRARALATLFPGDMESIVIGPHETEIPHTARDVTLAENVSCVACAQQVSRVNPLAVPATTAKSPDGWADDVEDNDGIPVAGFAWIVANAPTDINKNPADRMGHCYPCWVCSPRCWGEMATKMLPNMPTDFPMTCKAWITEYYEAKRGTQWPSDVPNW